MNSHPVALQKIKDIEIYMEMGLKKDKYYLVKRRAIYNLFDSSRDYIALPLKSRNSI